MPMEVKGSRLRIRVRTPHKGCIYRTQLLGGRMHHAQRIAMKCPGKRWTTQAFTIPVVDIKAMRPTTMALLGRIGKTRQAMRLTGVV
jgi:hypothetical protein